MKQISLANLFELGAHRGNSKSRLNPKLSSRVHTIHGGVCIIDLVKTIEDLEAVSSLLSDLGKKRKQVLIVGTSKHINPLIPDFAKSFDGTEVMPYVNNRWLGGTLTNWSTVKKTLKTLVKLESIEANDEFYSKLARNEQLRVRNERAKIATYFEGLKPLKNNRPGAVLVLDAVANPIAIREADVVGVPVITVTNTTINVLPADRSGVIVCNTNSLKTVEFVKNYLSESYNSGYKESLKTEEKPNK